ncbi:hypothetical protein ACOZ0S_004297 [Cronobacter dublinensis]
MMTFVWDGNRLLSETCGGRSHLWIYEDDSSRRWRKSACAGATSSKLLKL